MHTPKKQNIHAQFFWFNFKTKLKRKQIFNLTIFNVLIFQFNQFFPYQAFFPFPYRRY